MTNTNWPHKPMKKMTVKIVANDGTMTEEASSNDQLNEEACV